MKEIFEKTKGACKPKQNNSLNTYSIIDRKRYDKLIKEPRIKKTLDTYYREGLFTGQSTSNENVIFHLNKVDHESKNKFVLNERDKKNPRFKEFNINKYVCETPIKWSESSGKCNNNPYASYVLKRPTPEKAHMLVQKCKQKCLVDKKRSGFSTITNIEPYIVNNDTKKTLDFNSIIDLASENNSVVPYEDYVSYIKNYISLNKIKLNNEQPFYSPFFEKNMKKKWFLVNRGSSNLDPIVDNNDYDTIKDYIGKTLIFMPYKKNNCILHSGDIVDSDNSSNFTCYVKPDVYQYHSYSQIDDKYNKLINNKVQEISDKDYELNTAIDKLKETHKLNKESINHFREENYKKRESILDDRMVLNGRLFDSLQDVYSIRDKRKTIDVQDHIIIEDKEKIKQNNMTLKNISDDIQTVNRQHAITHQSKLKREYFTLFLKICMLYFIIFVLLLVLKNKSIISMEVMLYTLFVLSVLLVLFCFLRYTNTKNRSKYDYTKKTFPVAKEKI